MSDAQNRRVYVFGRSGDLRRVIGRGGAGPGELSAPFGITMVSDTLLAVDDPGAGKILLYTYPDGRYVRDVRRTGDPTNFVARGDTVWMGIMRNALNSSITEWAAMSDSLTYSGFIPVSYAQSERMRQVYGYVAIDVTDDAFYQGFLADTLIYRSDRRSGARSSVHIPALSRRGVPPDIAARLQRTDDLEDYARMVSSLIAINVPAADSLQAVHYDVTYDNKIISAAGFFSTVSMRTGKGCVDSRLEFSPDSRPYVAFAGDTLVTLEQRVVAQKGVTYVRFLKHPKDCADRATS